MSNGETVPRDTISSLVIEWMQEYNIPGCSVAITDSSNIVFTEGYGTRNQPLDLPATTETLYGIGSCTKLLTAISILQLYQDDKIQLDDSISDYVNHFQSLDREVTIHDLLTHTSGIPSDGFLTGRLDQLTGRVENKTGPPLTTASDFEQHIDRSLDYRASDSSLRYYNTGYILLGDVIENVSGISYSEYISTNILEPLGIDNMYFLDDDEEILEDGNVITPYITSTDSIREGELYLDPRLNSAGGLFMSVSDLALILRNLLNRCTTDGVEILNESSFEKLITEHITDSTYVDGSEKSYGYGIRVEPFADDMLISHTGSMAVSSAWMGGLLNQGVGVTIACNTAPNQHPKIVARAILAVLIDHDPTELVYQYKRKNALKSILGDYESQSSIVVAKVDEFSSGIKIKFNHASSLGTYTAFPADLNNLEYYTILDNGKRLSITFETGADDVRMHFDRWILSQT